MQSKLFTPLEYGALKLKNRINIPPMCTWQAADGLAQDFHRYHYAALASSGAGAVTIEAVGVVPEGRISPFCLGLWDDDRADGIASIVEAMKKAAPDVKVLVQLNHAGRKGSMDPNTDIWMAPAQGGWHPVGPSVMHWSDNLPEPHELSAADIAGIVQKFAEAAARAVMAGCDGIMIHAAHGFLIHEFLSPLSNQRTDDYGGNFDNRCRFYREVLAAVKAAVPEDCAVGVRLSAVDWVEGGVSIDDTIKYVDIAAQNGCCFADISTGGLLSVPIPVAPGYQLPFAAQVKAHCSLPVFGVGLITNAYQAETVLQLGACDAIDVGRAALSDPNWGWHAAKELRVKEVSAPNVAKFFALGR